MSKRLGVEHDRQQRTNRNNWRGQGEQADWASVSSELVLGAVCAGTNNGWAVRFGYTRDGGAYTLGILGDGEPYTEYIRPNEDIDLALRAFIAYAEGSK